MRPLTFKRRLFVDAFLGDAKGNATEAARIAGYRSPHPEGSRLLQNATVKAAIDQKLTEAALASREVLARLSEQATGSIADLMTIDDDGNPTIDLKRAVRTGAIRLVKKLRRTVHGLDIELHDAQAALIQLGRFHGLWIDRQAHEFDKLTDEELLAHVQAGITPEAPATNA